MSLVHRWRASWRSDHVAIQLPDGTPVTYGALERRIGKAVTWLSGQGVGAGSIVAMQLPKDRRFLELHLALLTMGAATLPMNTQYTPEEVHYLVDDADADLVLLDDDAPSPGRRAVRLSDIRYDDLLPARLGPPVDPGALAVLCYTSGTTGRPKGARISQRAIGACVDALDQAWGWRPDDVLLHALPLFHIHGLFVAQHGALRAGATAVWMSRFEADAAFRLIEDHGVTVVMGVPTFYHRFLTHPGPVDVSTVRLFTSGSAPLPARDHERFRARFGASIVERYGMTEIGIVLSNPLRGERRPGTVGFPLPGVRLRITDESGADVRPGSVGEVRIQGPSLFDGYHGRPEASRAAVGDGWMHTEDLGWQDPEGYVHLVGRQSDLILRGGMNVYPPEVEAVLLQVDGVAEAAVFGLPDPDLGERVAVAWAGPASRSALEEAVETLAPFKRPVVWVPVDELPRNTMGKVQKAVLRDRYGAIVVRDATTADADFLVGGNLALARESEGLELDAEVVGRGVRAGLEGKARYLIAELAGEAVGQLMLTTEWSDWRSREVWWIQSVYVLPAARRRGVYRTLYATVMERARAAGVGGVRLYVDLRNEPAIATYRALGMDGGHYQLFEAMLAPEAP